ncbi:MAG: hypothetical protein HQ556_13710 [Candidatus Marinimicrobia bacterium]|nr:hypothetical protein [Candidatus Neomarinimicrobiota bacterium]
MEQSKTVNVLDTTVGAMDDGRRELKVIDISVGKVTFEDDSGTRDSDKIYLNCKTVDDGHELKISEAWVVTRSGHKKTQGLWVQLDKNKQIHVYSTLGKLLTYHNVGTANELIGQTVLGYPDEKGFMALTTYDTDKKNSN